MTRNNITINKEQRIGIVKNIMNIRFKCNIYKRSYCINVHNRQLNFICANSCIMCVSFASRATLLITEPIDDFVPNCIIKEKNRATITFATKKIQQKKGVLQCFFYVAKQNR